jgi:hypothetical protein
MDTQESDAAMLLELNEKITHRIREQIVVCMQGFEQDYAGEPLDISFVRNKIVSDLAMHLLQNSTFITSITKAVVQKLNTASIY